MVLGPGFDPCCHFLGPRKLRQEDVCWSGGGGPLEIFSLSKQQLMWLPRDRGQETHIHSCLAALVFPLAPLKTNPSIHLSRQAVLKREVVVCVLSQSTSRSISEGLYLRGKLKSYSAGPPKPELISEAVHESMWLRIALPWIPEIPDFAVDSTVFPHCFLPSPFSFVFTLQGNTVKDSEELRLPDFSPGSCLTPSWVISSKPLRLSVPVPCQWNGGIKST